MMLKWEASCFNHDATGKLEFLQTTLIFIKVDNLTLWPELTRLNGYTSPFVEAEQASLVYSEKPDYNYLSISRRERYLN